MSRRTYAGTSELVTAGLLGAITVLLAWFSVLFFTTENPARATSPHEIADQFGISIVWTNENCGAALGGDHGTGGCFNPRTPDVIYVSPGMSPEVERHIVLHEIGHALNHRLGVEITECAADLFAESMGSPYPPDACN